MQRTIERYWLREQPGGRYDPEGRTHVTGLAGSNPTGGKWSRPDITAVSARTYEFPPSTHLDIVGFEVKKAATVDISAAYTCLSYRKFCSESYVAIYSPYQDIGVHEMNLAPVEEEAERLGVGLVTFGDPADTSTWETGSHPVRHDPEPSALDEFIRIQLPERIHNYIRDRCHRAL